MRTPMRITKKRRSPSAADRHTVSRRDLLKTIAVTGAAVSVGPWIVRSAHAAGSELRIAVSGDLNTLDPAKTKIGEEYLVTYMVYSGLTWIGHGMSAEPALAESWTNSEDSKTWSFKLRKGVKFHSGRELVADDVLAMMERTLDKSTGSRARSFFTIVDKMDRVDSHTVKFQLNTPYGDFADLFFARPVRVWPRDKVDKIAESPDGTGPFKFVSYTPGDKVVLEKNENYWKPGLPKVDRLVYRIIPESAAALAALETGEVDIVWNLSLEAIDKVKANNNLDLSMVETTSWDALAMNNAVKPFDDLRVRQAIAKAVDKRQITELSLFGHGAPTHTPIPPSHPYFNKGMAIEKPDIGGAKKLLAEAGMPDGFEVTLYVPNNRPTRNRFGVAVREQLKTIGVRANVQPVPWDKMVADIEGKAGFYVTGFFARPTVDTNTWPFWHSTGSWNNGIWKYKNTEMDKILESARLATGEADRKRIYGEFQKLAVNDSPGVVPFVVNHACASRKSVGNFRAHWMLIMDLEGVTVS